MADEMAHKYLPLLHCTGFAYFRISRFRRRVASRRKHWIADVRAIRSEGQPSDLQSYFCDSGGDDAALAANDRKVPQSRRQGGAEA